MATNYGNYGNLDDDTRDSLQDLLSINIDSQKGWQQAAENVKDPQLQTFFRQMSEARRQNAEELRSIVGASGEEPTDRGSMSGQIHRWWIDAKQAMTGGDAESVLNEAERGEDSIKDEYEEKLEDLRGTPVAEVVRRQYENVRDGHDQVRAMRDRYRNPA